MSRISKMLLIILLLLSPSRISLAEDVTYGITTTQEGSGIAAGIQKALSDAFPEHQFSYIVAGTSTSLRSLKDNLIPFAITHNPDNEKKLTTEGMFARYPLYANDFLIVGPEESDLDCDSMKECLESIFSLKLPFTSRGDQSGTHLFELDRWAELGIEPTENDFYQQASGGRQAAFASVR